MFDSHLETVKQADRVRVAIGERQHMAAASRETYQPDRTSDRVIADFGTRQVRVDSEGRPYTLRVTVLPLGVRDARIVSKSILFRQPRTIQGRKLA